MQDEEKEEVYIAYDSDPEIEKDDVVSIMDPFNPEDISIDTKVFSMDSCLRRLVQGTITLNPDFQRAEVWTDDRKSQLIESLMLRIPLPMFYVSADEKNHFTVVDGLQRLSTIRSFILGDEYLKSWNEKDGTYDEKKKGFGFRLQSLEFWKGYEGKNYNDLPVNIKNRILETELSFTIINPATPEEVRRNIFKRLNTGGMPLSSQEIRNALYLGASTKLLNHLSTFDEFHQATAFSIKKLRMEDRELILRFLSFLIRDYSTYRKAVSIDTYLSDTMIIINALPDLETKEFVKLKKSGNIEVADINVLGPDVIETKFRLAMIRASKLFTRHAFRNSFGNNRRAPVNKALFETWGVLLSKLTSVEFEKLMSNNSSFLEDYGKIITSGRLESAISRDSMQTSSVRLRFEIFQKLINNAIK